jgi:hypothetical protein
MHAYKTKQKLITMKVNTDNGFKDFFAFQTHLEATKNPSVWEGFCQNGKLFKRVPYVSMEYYE